MESPPEVVTHAAGALGGMTRKDPPGRQAREAGRRNRHNPADRQPYTQPIQVSPPQVLLNSSHRERASLLRWTCGEPSLLRGHLRAYLATNSCT